MAATIGALQALRAVALVRVLVLLLVAAPAAAVLEPCGDAGARESGAKDLLRVRFAQTLGAIGTGKEQGARSVLDLMPDPGLQRLRNRKDGGDAALRGLAVV